MSLKRLNINPVVEIVKSTIVAKGMAESVGIETDSLEVLVGAQSRRGMRPFGRVTMDVPSGYLVVRTAGGKYIDDIPRADYQELMETIAGNLADHYEVTYIVELTMGNRSKRSDHDLL